MGNVPDDYHTYWRRCPVCGQRVHPAEQPECLCDEIGEDAARALKELRDGHEAEEILFERSQR